MVINHQKSECLCLSFSSSAHLLCDPGETAQIVQDFTFYALGVSQYILWMVDAKAPLTYICTLE